jgi:WD40 repeat protein
VAVDIAFTKSRKDFKYISSQLQRMKSYHSTASSDLGLPKDSYVYSIAATAAQKDTRTEIYQTLTPSDRLAVISSDDSLRLFDPSTLKLLPDGLFPKANTGLTSLKRFAANGQDCNVLMTAGRDGRVRAWDLRSHSKVLEFQAPKDQPLSALDCNVDLSAVVAGMELEGDGPGDVRIFGWDVRNPVEVKMSYVESHGDTITELRFIPHAESSSLLLSASTDGLINIFDTSVAEEDDALFQVVNHRSALHHAGLIGNDIYGLGTDETLSFYAFQSPDPDVEEPKPSELGDIRESLDCEYVVSLAYSGAKPLLALGNHSSQWLDLLHIRPQNDTSSGPPDWEIKADERVRLQGAHGEELVRDIFVTDTVAFTCGEDGIVRQWTMPGDEDVEMSGTKSSKRRRDDGGGRKEKKSKSSRQT